MSGAIATKDLGPGRSRVSSDEVRLGKDLIEILTTGMYVSPLTIYREYIQNAADSIDVARAQGLFSGSEEGRISVTLDQSSRSAIVRDNGAGIPKREALRILLGIGGSAKRGTPARGFRGVGRLSGLAYCRELEFRMKAAGEDTVISVCWDCYALRERLGSMAYDGDVERIVSDVVTVWYEASQSTNEHFFEVRLNEIGRHRNDLLLNEKIISSYVSQVAPIAFSPDFTYGSVIDERLSSHSTRNPVEITIQGDKVYRPHRDEMPSPGTSRKTRVREIEFIEFANIDGELGAFGWIAHHEYERSIPASVGVRGLRARVGDLQVGDATLFEESFKEARFNSWSIGEIHILDRRIVPNARRDNFEINHHYYNLLVQIGPLTTKTSQRARTASVTRTAAQIVDNIISDIEAKLKTKTRVDRAEISRLKAAVMRGKITVKRLADPQLRLRLDGKLDRLMARLVKVTPRKGKAIVVYEEVAAIVGRVIKNREQANKLMEELRLLAG